MGLIGPMGLIGLMSRERRQARLVPVFEEPRAIRVVLALAFDSRPLRPT